MNRNRTIASTLLATVWAAGCAQGSSTTSTADRTPGESVEVAPGVSIGDADVGDCGKELAYDSRRYEVSESTDRELTLSPVDTDDNSAAAGLIAPAAVFTFACAATTCTGSCAIDVVINPDGTLSAACTCQANGTCAWQRVEDTDTAIEADEAEYE